MVMKNLISNTNKTQASTVTTTSTSTTKVNTTITPTPDSTSSSSQSWSTAPPDSLPRPPMWKVWLLASRPHTLTASLSPCLVGYAICRTYSYSFSEHHMSQQLMQQDQQHQPPPLSLVLLFFQVFFFCILIQLATNLHNDYADYVKGADTKDRVGPARATQRGWLSPFQTAAASTACLVAALLLGMTALMPKPTNTATIDWFFVFFLASSCFNAVAYTGGPYPLGCIGLGHVSIAYWGLGDIFCFLYFGYAAVMAQPYLLYRAYEATAASNTTTHTMASIVTILYEQRLPLGQALPAALLCTAIIVVNNLRDVHTDALAQKRTVAVRCGIRFVQWEYTCLILGTYASILIMATSWWHRMPCLTIPLAVKTTHTVWTRTGRDLNACLGMTALLELGICSLQSIGMIMAATRGGPKS